MPRRPSLERLEYLDRHPLRMFFWDNDMTLWRVNDGVAVIGVMALYGGLTGYGHPVVLVIAVAAAWLLRKNDRRFRERVRYAIAEAEVDAAPGQHSSGRSDV